MQRDDIDHDLQITRTQIRRQAGGTWISGQIAGHQFQVLVFRDHAANPQYEFGRSRISKFWLKRLSDQRVVFNFDRGLDVAVTDALAQQIVDYLAEGIATLADED